MLRAYSLFPLFVAVLTSACGDTSNQNDAFANVENGGNSANGSANVSNSDGSNASNGFNASNGSTASNASSTSNAGNAGNAGNAERCSVPAPFDEGATYTSEVRIEPGEDLEGALRNATPGTRITLGAGSHPGGIFADGVVGTADNPIAIVGEEGAVIEGGGNNIQLSNPSYVVIEGITFRNASSNGLNIDDGSDYSSPANNVVLRDIVVEDVGSGGNQDCVKLSGLDDFHIEGITVRGCSGQGVDMVGCHDGVITGNSLNDMPGAGVQAKGGTSDILVHGNTFERVEGRGVNAGGSTGLEFFRPIDAPHEGAGIVVVANVFVDVGASSGAPIAFVGCDECTFANNTIVRPLTWVARILQETAGERFVPSRDGAFVNNIIVFDSEVLRSFVNVGAGTAPETFVFQNNLWWDLSDPDFDGPDLTGVPSEVDGIVAEPELETDFTIDASSPAAGAASGALGVPDHGGVCFGDPPSIGAFEVR